MPGMDGNEAARAIRALQAARELHPPPAGHWAAGREGGSAAVAQRALPRILALTANAADEDRMESLAAGMNAILPKPVQPDGLRRAVLDQVGLAMALLQAV